jgi:hypothetical protein
MIIEPDPSSSSFSVIASRCAPPTTSSLVIELPPALEEGIDEVEPPAVPGAVVVGVVVARVVVLSVGAGVVVGGIGVGWLVGLAVG